MSGIECYDVTIIVVSYEKTVSGVGGVFWL